MLVPIVQWVVAGCLPDVEVVGKFADYISLRQRPKGLTDQLRASPKLFPCELLVVHRDAETQERARRVDEVRTAIEGLAEADTPYVCAVPVRMSEAWCLFDEYAIRCAAGNPNGVAKLVLPPLKTVEAVADPKALLKAALETASEYGSRRLDKFDAAGRARRVTGYIESFEPLRRLKAFHQFEAEVRETLAGWQPAEA